MVLKKDFETSIKFSNLLLRLSGITLNLNAKNAFNYFVAKWLFYFNVIWLYTDVAGEFIYINDAMERGKDIIEIASLFPCIAISVLSLGKSLSLFLNQDNLKSILDTFKEIHPNTNVVDNIDDTEENNYSEHPNGEERKTVNDTIKLINISIMSLGLLIIFVITCLFALPLVIMVHSYYTTGEYEFTTPFLVKYFFNIDSKFKWFLVYIHHIWSSVASEFYYIQDALAAGKDVIRVAAVLPCMAISFLSLWKGLYLFINQDTLKSIFDQLKEIHPNVDVVDNDNDNDDENYSDHPNEVERKLVQDTIKLINNTTMALGVAMTFVVVCFLTLPIALMVHSYRTTGEYEYLTPFLTKYFFELDTVPKWLMVYSHHVWSALIVVANVYSSDILVFLFCTYLKMHFELVGKRFETILCTTSLTKTRRDIKNLAIRHQELLSLVEKMDVLFSKSTLVQCVITSIIICFCMFIATFTDNTVDFVTYAMFFIMILTEILLLCYFGNMLISSSSEFGASVYKCNWYEVDPAMMKDILFIIKRSQKPCKISAMGYADLKLMTFTSILSSSWSYFALLRTMYD